MKLNTALPDSGNFTEAARLWKHQNITSLDTIDVCSRRFLQAVQDNNKPAMLNNLLLLRSSLRKLSVTVQHFPERNS